MLQERDHCDSSMNGRYRVPVSELNSALRAQRMSCENMLRQIDHELLNTKLALKRCRRLVKANVARSGLRGYRRRLLQKKCQGAEAQMHRSAGKLAAYRRRWRQSVFLLRVLRRKSWTSSIRRTRQQHRKFRRRFTRYRRLMEADFNQACYCQKQVANTTGWLRRIWILENSQRVLQLRRQKMTDILWNIQQCQRLAQVFHDHSNRRQDLVVPYSDITRLLLSGDLERALRLR